MSTTAQQISPSTTIIERRFYPRILPQTPIFIAFNENDPEESLLLNVSENGLLVSSSTGLACNFVARLSLPLNGLPKPIQVTGRVVWESEMRKLAGIQLLDLNEHDRQQLRKWGARESAQPWQPEHPQTEPRQTELVNAPISTTSSETAHTACPFVEEAPAGSPSEIVALAPPIIIRPRSTSIIARRVILAALVATVCLGATVLLIKAAPGLSFVRSRYFHTAPSSAVPPTPPNQGTPENQDRSKPATVAQPAPPTPTPSPTKVKTPLAAAPPAPHSQQIEQAAAGPSPVRPAVPSVQNPSSKSPTQSNPPSAPAPETVETPAPPRSIAKNSPVAQTEPSQPAATSVPPDAPAEADTAAAKSSASAGATPEAPVVSPDPPSPKQPLANPARPNDLTTVNPSPIPSSPSNSVIAPTRTAPPLKSASPVIQMDPPRNQVYEVRLPSGYQAPFLNLPGDRVLESPSVTIHIQRSVRLPATHAGWPFNRNKKVVVGEMISRVDPQVTQIPATSANSIRVRATIGKDGQVENINSILGPSNLVPIVSKALRDWRYQPTLVDDKPVETQCYVVFQFHVPPYRAARH